MGEGKVRDFNSRICYSVLPSFNVSFSLKEWLLSKKFSNNNTIKNTTFTLHTFNNSHEKINSTHTHTQYVYN